MTRHSYWKTIAHETRLPYTNALRRFGQHHQVGANRAQRLTQSQQAYRCVRSKDLQGAHVVPVDDVLTTGATLEAATRVSGLVFAQA
jgi:predicted amidophosphoribosyltransferase